MLQKKQFMQIILTVVVLMVITMMFLPNDLNQEHSGEQNVLFSGFADEIELIGKVKISDKNRTLTFIKSEDWGIEEKSGYPVKNEAFRELLMGLSKGHIAERKTSNPEKYEKLQVADPGKEGSGVLLEIFREQDPVVELIVGKNSQGIAGSYVRKKGEEQSYLLDRKLQLSLDASDWIDKSLLDIADTEVKSIVREAGEGAFKLLRDSAENDFVIEPAPQIGTLNDGYQLRGLTSALKGLSMTDVYPKADKSLKDNYKSTGTVIFETFDGIKLVIAIFKNGDDDGLIELSFSTLDNADEATRNKVALLNKKCRDWMFKLSNFKLDELTRKYDDLIEVVEKDAEN